MSNDEYKNCPFCDEEIKEIAVKCRYCKSPLDDNTDDIYYLHNDERKGPVNESELIDLIKSRTLNRNSILWRKEFGGWQPISNTNFDKYIEEPPPLSGDVINNTVVWWLAFAPLIGLLIEYIISSATGIGIYNLFFITIILNIYLGYLDDKLLKKAGYDTNLLGIVWLVPVYLFRRASILKQSNAYGIIWCATFVIMFLLY